MKMMRSLITALASLVILLTSVPSVLIAEEHVVYRPSQGSPATPFEWIYQTNVGRQQTREQDRPALQEALRIAFDNLPRDNALTRLLGLANNSGLCMGAGVDLWKDLTNVAITPGSSMFGWNVQVIENGCHVANLLSSPDNIKHYYIENNLSLRLIEMITLDGGGTWQPLLDDAVGRSYMFTTCHLGLVFPPAAMLWTIVPGGVIPVPTAPICQIPRETHSLDIQVVGSIDPNEKLGSNGAGAEKYLSSIEPLRYTILFENLETATAPAQEILIVDQLDAVTMDFSSLKLGPITFGQTIISPPTGSQSFSTIVDLRPDNNLLIRLDIGLDQDTGLLTWSFVATDPVTGQLPEDPLAGFLPPNVTPPEGDGSVLFTVMPKQGLPTDTEIRNSASIVFDTNAPILTPEWLNTLDNNKPSSAVIPLALTQSTTSFNVEWSGIDQGAGIKDYTIWFSEDGGDFVPWLTNIAEVSATFSGGSGKTYAFYSVARDLTGNIEDIPGLADTNTAIDPDTDSDGLLDGVDNCILVSNPTQCDGDNDGYGNHCDADFNNDLIVNGLDIGLFKAGFGTTDVVTDLNCDGITNGLDIGLLKVLFGSPPGPSGLVP